jgi:hypothetical protein
VSADAAIVRDTAGLRAVNNWGAHFAPSRKSTAQEQLGGRVSSLRPIRRASLSAGRL